MSGTNEFYQDNRNVMSKAGSVGSSKRNDLFTKTFSDFKKGYKPY